MPTRQWLRKQALKQWYEVKKGDVLAKKSWHMLTIFLPRMKRPEKPMLETVHLRRQLPGKPLEPVCC